MKNEARNRRQSIRCILGLLIFLLTGSGFAQDPQPQVTDVWVVFKTHFDLGYTDLPENVYARYRGEMMDNALKMTDVPSHSWVMPTLLNHAGIKFLQLGCNPASQYSRFPELFWWEGPDGSRILCHYTADYGSDIKPTRTWPHKNYLAMQMTYVIGQFLHERFSSNEIDLWKNTYGISNIWGIHDYGKFGMPEAVKVPYLAFTPGNWKISVSHSRIADVAVLSTSDHQGFAKEYTLVFTFPRNQAYVDVEWKVDTKTAEKHPEGGWLCFPFAVDKPTFTIGRLGGPIDPATDIIPGSARYLMDVNTGVAVTQADNTGMVLSALDSPLLSFGEPGLWKFSMFYVPKTPTVFVNLYNNMWNTNFPLWQEGSWTERVRIWSKPTNEQTVANLTKKSWEAGQLYFKHP